MRDVEVLRDVEVALSRRELADYIAPAFVRATSVGREELLETLEQQQAPGGMVEPIRGRVPADARLTGLRDLWRYVPELPVRA